MFLESLVLLVGVLGNVVVVLGFVVVEPVVVAAYATLHIPTVVRGILLPRR